MLDLSFIRTIPSVLELHQVSICSWTLPPVRNYTLPWKIIYGVFLRLIISNYT